jgi:hypothetical protein
MSPKDSPILLNANQRRHFEVLFARLEDALVRVETLLGPASGHPQVLSIIEDDLADSFREQARPVISTLRAQLVRLASDLELRPQRVSRSRVIAATLHNEAIRLQDSVSSQIRGYGEVDPSVARQLDPILADIARTLSGLSAEVRTHSRRSADR